MKILLDTHILVWMHTDDTRLTSKVLEYVMKSTKHSLLQFCKYLGIRNKAQYSS